MYSKTRSKKTSQRPAWYVAILVIVIPVFVIAVSFNCAVRIADAYNWQMDKIQEQAASEDPGNAVTLNELDIYVDTAVLSSEISDFMKHKSSELETLDRENELYDYYVASAASFSDMDYHALKAVRTAADILAILGIAAFIWIAVMFMYHIREGYRTKHTFRRIFLASLIVQAVLQAVFAVVFAAAPVRRTVTAALFGISLSEGDLLPAVLGSNIAAVMVVFELGICIAVTAIMFYIIWVCTKPRDVFNERRYFR